MPRKQVACLAAAPRACLRGKAVAGGGMKTEMPKRSDAVAWLVKYDKGSVGRRILDPVTGGGSAHVPTFHMNMLEPPAEADPTGIWSKQSARRKSFSLTPTTPSTVVLSLTQTCLPLDI